MRVFLKTTASLAVFPYLVSWFWFFVGPLFFGWTPDIVVAAVFCISVMIFSTSDIALMLKKYNIIKEDTFLGLGVMAGLLWIVFIWNIMSVFSYNGVLNGTYLCAYTFIIPWWITFIVCKIKKQR